MKPPSPLLGFNNNVRHKGRVFHIQTEDSGVRHPHIITHLFADGGRILKTTKTSYAEFIDAANMGEVVRQMMQDQHKAMFMALRDGQFDHLVEELPAARGSSSGQTNAKMPAPAAAPAAPPAAAAPAGAPTLASAPAVASGAAAVSANASIAATGPLSTRDVRQVLAREPPLGPPPLPLVNPLGHAPTLPSVAAQRTESVSVGPQAAPHPGAQRAPEPPPPAIVRERSPEAARPQAPIAPAAAVVSVPMAPPIAIVPSVPPVAGGSSPSLPSVSSPPAVPASPPPPPAPRPAALVSRPTPARVASARPRLDIDPAAIHRAPEPGPAHASTLASVVEATVEGGSGIDLDTLERAAAEAETPLFQQIRDLPPPPAAVIGARPPSASPGGYSSVSPPLPAAGAPPSTRGRYAPSRPSSIFASVRPQEGASIFGEDLISEKSLDEVILSYLAEDLDGPGEKK